MVNKALSNNPPAGDFHITTHASDWLWAVFSIMLLSLLISLLWTGLGRHRNRIPYQIPVVVLTVSPSSATGGGTRQVWYVRYIQWFINAPLILLGLLIFTNMTVSDILTTLFFSWVVVVSGLIGALVSSSYKWGYYAFGLAALFYLWYRLFGHSSRYPFRVGQNVRSGYWGLAAYVAFIWTLYPICWGLSEGSNTISPTSEMVFYGILDVIAGPLFLFFYMLRVSTLQSTDLSAASLSAADRGDVEPKEQPVTGTGAAAAEARTSSPTRVERRIDAQICGVK
ncbi:hypothetical protein EDD16DRAFT_1696834 [Pisolithus croceorrhizus]|nr:hypothetical protein EDD16DRAFT_1696834 [Pisolithus croceorrhizus]